MASHKPHAPRECHPRNRYADKLDFKALCEEFEELKPLRDFSLTWSLTPERLCPTVPSRLNYIHWLEDLLIEACGTACATQNAHGKHVKVIDIGVGSSAIYPLIGQRRCRACVPAADASAKSQIDANKLEKQIRLVHVKQGQFLEPILKDTPTPTALTPALLETIQHQTPAARLKTILKNHCHIAATMCNPPFFDSLADANQGPHTANTGVASELVTPGGELAFVTGIVQDSVRYPFHALWFTTMLGRKANLKPLLKLLREAGAHVTRVTEFIQGKQTRWGVGWSFFPASLFLGGRSNTENTQQPAQQSAAAMEEDGAAETGDKADEKAAAAGGGGGGEGVDEVAAGMDHSLMGVRNLNWKQRGDVKHCEVTNAPKGTPEVVQRLREVITTSKFAPRLTNTEYTDATTADQTAPTDPMEVDPPLPPQFNLSAIVRGQFLAEGRKGEELTYRIFVGAFDPTAPAPAADTTDETAEADTAGSTKRKRDEADVQGPAATKKATAEAAVGGGSEPVHVAVAICHGPDALRKSFWMFFNTLKQDVERTNRKWRRQALQKAAT